MGSRIVGVARAGGEKLVRWFRRHVGFALSTREWPAGTAAGPEQTPAAVRQEEQTVTLQEIPVWEVEERVRNPFLSGQRARTQTERLSGTKCPAFKSAAPLYGRVRFENVAHRPNGCGHFDFALDHSEGTPGAYDLLYFDENADGDLTDDVPRRPLREPPGGLALPRWSTREEIYFEPVKVSFDLGPEGPRAVELLPQLWVLQDRAPRFSFIPKNVRWGRFEIAGTSYDAFLGHWPTVTGRFDLPLTALLLRLTGGEFTRWLGGDRLKSAHLLSGRHYRFSCTPSGDKLSLRPYDGPLGVLELGAGGRTVSRLEMEGCLVGPEMIVPVGDSPAGGPLRPTRQCRIPAGDYRDWMLFIALGNVRFVALNNRCHVSAQPPADQSAPCIGIREDKPFVLDFSHEPAVVFLQPEPSQRVALGDEVRIDTTLVDPVLNLMIGGLEDMTRVESQGPAAPGAGGRARERGVSLDPTLTVARADGRRVALAVLPFG